MSDWCVLHYRKNILKFVFENSSFEIADVYQSLIGICFAAVAINKLHTFVRLPHGLCDIGDYLHEIDRKWRTGNSVVFILLQWYCAIDLRCDCAIKFALKSLNVPGDITPWVYTGLDHLTQSTRFKMQFESLQKYTCFRSIPRTPSLVIR